MEERLFMNHRRLRANRHMLELAAQVWVSHKNFIQPLFADQTLTVRKAQKDLHGIFSDTKDSILFQIENDLKNGISKFLLFPVPSHKTDTDFSFDFAAEVTRCIKERFGHSVWLANDVCLCSYTRHGHCGVLNPEKNTLLNTETVKVLCQYSLCLAQAGSNCIAPSDMSDGRIGAIRQTLNEAGKEDVAIMSYAAKFHSAFYGPFRDVCQSSPDKSLLLNDRSSYQIDYRNPSDAIATALRDAAEGADILMVKPSLPYLDVVSALRAKTYKPLAVYHVSGEYAGLEAIASAGWAERRALHVEVWTAFKRSGADIIISYAARCAQEWLA
jgi:porphobilinogen synthase